MIKRCGPPNRFKRVRIGHAEVGLVLRVLEHMKCASNIVPKVWVDSKDGGTKEPPLALDAEHIQRRDSISLGEKYSIVGTFPIVLNTALANKCVKTLGK